MTQQEAIPAGKVPREESCGWFCFRPGYLQFFRSPKIFLFCVCCGVTMQGFIINGLINISITSIERRFRLSSAQTGLIAGMYDIAATLFSIPIAYAGGRAAASKPRWIGTGLLIMGTGAFMFCLPHFATGAYIGLSSAGSHLCSGGAGGPRPSRCSAGDAAADQAAPETGVSSFLYMFLFAQVLHGIGAAPLWSLAVAYIDANVKKKLVSVFLGIYYTMGLVGPAMGFLGGSTLLSVHTDFMSIDPARYGLDQRSEGWVGAWWLGFLVASFITWAVALPVLAFPTSLPQSKDLDPDSSETHGGRDSQQLEKIENKLAEGKLRDLPTAVWGCVTNPTFLCISLAGATDGAFISGISTFMPKYIQNQLGLPASQAGLFTGAAALVGGATGTVLGGYLVKRLQLRCPGIIKLIVIFSAVSFVTTFVFMASCPNVPFAGINTPYSNGSVESDSWAESQSGGLAARLGSQCNRDCGCLGEEYEPTCGSDGVTYYSPCHAGCTTQTATRNFTDCSCFGGEKAVRGKCKSQCSYLPLLVVIQTVAAFCLFVGTSPSSTAIVRSVAPRQRSLAMGISVTILRLVGTIPGPIIYGSLIDRSCVLWQSTCGGTGSCLVYDNRWMSRYLLIATLCWKFASLLFYNLAWILYKAPEGSEEAEIPKEPQDAQNGGAVQISSIDGRELPAEGGVSNPAFELTEQPDA